MNAKPPLINLRQLGKTYQIKKDKIKENIIKANTDRNAWNLQLHWKILEWVDPKKDTFRIIYSVLWLKSSKFHMETGMQFYWTLKIETNWLFFIIKYSILKCCSNIHYRFWFTNKKELLIHLIQVSKNVSWSISSNSISKSTSTNWALLWFGVHRTIIFVI